MMNSWIDALNRYISPLRDRISLMVGRGRIENVNVSKQLAHVQLSLLSDEVQNDIELIQQYGFSSVPKIGAEAVAIFVGGNRSHGIIIATEDRQYRIPGVAGEVRVYSHNGDNISLKEGNIIEINTQTLKINATTKVEINTPILDVNSTTSISMDAPLMTLNSTTIGIVDINGATINLTASVGINLVGP